MRLLGAQAIWSRTSRQRVLRPGATAEDDDFIEVHIWGPLSVRSLDRVFWKSSRKHKKAFRQELRDRLRNMGIELVEVS